MLPGLRAIAAIAVAAILLLAAAFGVTATVRVAQESRASPLQAVRQGLHTDIVRSEQVALVSAPREEPKPVAAAPVAAAPPPPVIVEPPVVIATAPPVAPPAAPVSPAPQAAMIEPPETSDDPDLTTSTLAAVPHADAEVAAVPLPQAEPPTGGPLQEFAALTPSDAPDVKPVKKAKARTVRSRGSRIERARAAARRIAAEQARARALQQQQPFQGFPATPQQRQQFPQAQPSFRN
jgi:hypothetical protein